MLTSVGWDLRFFCVKSRSKEDCVAAECTETGSFSRVKRLSLFCKVSGKMMESETPVSKTRFLPKRINHSSINQKTTCILSSLKDLSS